MKKLLIALALLAGSSSQLEAQTPPATNFPGGVTRPVFVLPTSSVTGGGVTPIPISAPQSCTTPAYTFTGATTSGYGFASSTACIVIGGTQRLGVTSTAATSTVPFLGPDGLVGAPAFGFASQPTTGFYTTGAGIFSTAISGVRSHNFRATSFDILSDSAQIRMGAAQDTLLSRLSAGVASTASMSFGAGTTTLPPMFIVNGTNLTTATANSIENDGTAFYKTQDTTNGRTYLDGWNYFRLTGSGTGITTIADFFGATGSGIPMVANGVYEIEWHAYFSQATAGTATWTVTTATTALANLTGEYNCSNIAGIGTVGAPQTAAINVTASSATAFPVTGTEATASTHYCTIRVIATAGAGASNTRLRLTMGAGTATPLINSYFRVRRLPGGNIGTFVS